jgi:hypothetical protein
MKSHLILGNIFNFFFSYSWSALDQYSSSTDSNLFRASDIPIIIIGIVVTNKNTFRGGFHKAIYILRLKFMLWHNLFSQHHVFAPYTQLIAFSPRFGCALRRATNFYEIHPRSCENLIFLYYTTAHGSSRFFKIGTKD